MIQIYGSPISSPTNKVRYVANYLNISNEFHVVNIAAGEQRSPEYLQINPYGKIPAIDDNGFRLAESNAIIRYLCDKQQAAIYPRDLKQRALVDQWIDYASVHVMLALSRIMYNTYYYKFAGADRDERSLQDGKKFIAQYLPVIEQQLARSKYIAANSMTLADIVMIAALDVVEPAHVDLSSYPHIVAWRNQLMKEAFYQNCHQSYAAMFNKMMEKMKDKV